MELTAGRTAPTIIATCDRSSCPAPAQRRLDVAGQDFYFCHHHAAEIDGRWLTASRTGALDGSDKVLVEV
jgi:hypothetical protein